MRSFGWAPAPSDCVPLYRRNVDAWTGTQGELQAKRQAEVRMMLRNTRDYQQTDLPHSEIHFWGSSHPIWILCYSSPSGLSMLTRNERRWRPQRKFHNHSRWKASVLIPPPKERHLLSSHPQQQTEDALERESDSRLPVTPAAIISFLHAIRGNYANSVAPASTFQDPFSI